MEIKKKVPRSLQHSPQDLEVVKPYWIARNVICHFPHERCSGHHGGIKLPKVKHYLKRGHCKMFTEQNIQRYQGLNVGSMLGLQSPNSNEDLDQGYDRSAKSKPYLRGGKHVSILQEQCNQQPKRFREFYGKSVGDGGASRNEEEGFREENSHGKQPMGSPGEHLKSNRHQGKDYSLGQGSSHKRQGSENLVFPPIHPQSNLLDQSEFSPLFSNRSINQYINNHNRQTLQNLQYLQNQYNQQKHQSPNYHQNPLNQEQYPSRRRVVQGNYRPSKLLGGQRSSLIKQERFSSFRQSPQHSQGAPSPHQTVFQHDKAMLFQQLSQTIKILQATLSKKQKMSVIDSNKVMSLVATSEILQKALKEANVVVHLEQFLSPDYIEVVREILKVLHRSGKYQEIIKEIEEKLRSRDLIAKKAVGTERQRVKRIRRSGREDETEEQGDEKQNLKSKYGPVKKHQRYNSDGMYLQRNKEQPYLSSINQAREDHRSKKGGKQILKQLNNPKLANPKLGIKQSITSKPKLGELGKISKHLNKKLKPTARKQIIFDKEKLQKIQKVNKTKNKRPKSNKANRDSFEMIREIKSYSSERLIEGKDRKSRRPLRSSFVRLLKGEKGKIRSIKGSKGTSNKNSKIPSCITTPPIDLIQEIDDEEENRLKSRVPTGAGTHQRSSLKQQLPCQSNQDFNRHKMKAKLNRFQLNSFYEIEIPSLSESQEEEQQESDPEDTLRADRKRQLDNQQNPDWNEIIKTVPKKKTKTKARQTTLIKRKTKKLVTELNTRYMVNLHRQVYRILDNRIPQFQQLRQTLLQHQKRIKQMRIIQDGIPQECEYSEQKWINGLDFVIKLKTNNREHVGSMRGQKILVRHDVDGDPMDLYEIACKESQVAERLQERERLMVFAQESVELGGKDNVEKEVLSYAF